MPPSNVSILQNFSFFVFFILQKCCNVKSINTQWPFVLNVPWFHFFSLCFGKLFLILNQKGTTAFYDLFELNALSQNRND